MGGSVYGEENCNNNTRAIFLDTPSNPLMKITDLRAAIFSSCIRKPGRSRNHCILSNVPREVRQRLGISANLIRISLGLEEINDLMADFTRAWA